MEVHCKEVICQGVPCRISGHVYSSGEHLYSMHAQLNKNCLCIAFLKVIGNGAIAQTVLPGANRMSGVPQFGSFLNINLGYGLALVLGLYASIGVSGGHLNPAVTFAMAVRGQLCWLKVH